MHGVFSFRRCFGTQRKILFTIFCIVLKYLSSHQQQNTTGFMRSVIVLHSMGTGFKGERYDSVP